MQVTENLLQRFFDQQCDADEANTVVSYLYTHPEEVEKWLGPDWQQAGKEIPVPASYRKEMWRSIEGEIQIHQPRKIEQRNIYLSVAAVLLIMLCGWWFFSTEYAPAVQQPVLAAQEKTGAIELRANTTKGSIHIQLPDGSDVTLEPGSTVTYAKEFAGTERKIVLNGNGFFDVTKNISKPFVVVTGEITTTALGTSFRVTENKEGVTVKLYTGKVVVNKISSDKHWGGPVYLLPGTSMNYSRQHSRTTVGSFDPEWNGVNKTIAKQQKNMKTPVQLSELYFDNTPLTDVLLQLEERFAIKIQYDSSVINNHFFTGKVLPTDSVETLLHVIGNMNGFMINKEGNNSFLLVKKQ